MARALAVRARAPPPRDALAGEFMKRKAVIAERLSAALRLQTVSYDEDRVAGAGAAPACAAFHSHGGAPAASAPATAPGGARRRRAASPARAAASAKTAAAPPLPAPAAAALPRSHAAFAALHALLRESYPRLHASAECSTVGGFSLGFLLRGADASLPAYALYAHLDVVPAPDGAAWRHDPFSGAIAEGYIHGRGAIDDKQAVIGICEAAEHLLGARRWRPRRTLAILFGHDEEIGGGAGAAALARWLAAALPAPPRRRRPLAFLLDEGLFVLRGAVPGVQTRTALVCTAEKGCASVALDVELPGGHASVPPPRAAGSAIGALARALARIDAAAAAAPPRLRGAAAAMLAALAPHASWPLRAVYANLWLFGPAVARALAAAPTTAALVRSTTALTVLEAGGKANVLPPSARAVLNHRTLPGDTVAAALARDAAAAGDARLRFTLLPGATEASVESDAAAPAFAIIARAVEGIYDSVAAAPALMVGATDSPHFAHLAENIYRHCPTELSVEETAMFHGRDERIGIDNLARSCAFYCRVMIEADAAAEL